MELKITHLSDTHGVHRRLRNLPEADILVHSGDFTMSEFEAETLDFLECVCDLPYRHEVLVAGNYDACLYGANLDGLDDNVHYLCGSGPVDMKKKTRGSRRLQELLAMLMELSRKRCW